MLSSCMCLRSLVRLSSGPTFAMRGTTRSCCVRSPITRRPIGTKVCGLRHTFCGIQSALSRLPGKQRSSVTLSD